MNINLSITTALVCDSEKIISVLDARALEVKKKVDNQSLIKRISVIAEYVFFRVACIVALACLPLTALTLSVVTPLSIAAVSVVLVVACQGFSWLIQERNPDEMIVRERWKALFIALRTGQGAKIVQTCEKLYAQKTTHKTAYNDCLGNLVPLEEPFLFKTSVIGHLLLALEYLEKKDFAKATTCADKSLKYFINSGFEPNIKIEGFIDAIIKKPDEIRTLMQDYPAEVRLETLDHWLFMRNKNIEQDSTV